MKKLFFAGIVSSVIIIGAVFAAKAQSKTNTSPPAAVPSVDLKKYAGMWYEIARYENRFEKNCAGNITANYALKDNGNIQVTNRCLKKNGKINEAVGEARIVDKTTNAKLEVRFAPSLLSFLPLIWGDYWIIDLASDYSYAVIGAPKRNYLWILSRSPQMSEPLYQEILHRIEQQGFNPAKVIRTNQNVETVKGTVIQKAN